ncbi:hypothetical protein N7468_000722 [Penicillium chermesinum]|uniref:Uncharacterized protein n=1 Tax=Penicillium chermesinum TaxID=63820 RepID=A0A9W9PKU2_9EURO|nr:uncharacterized protein N7468_000722 [Penicillium chermesinum]KAJ5249271.1 hypothetical protein N7468_000722 [Penicillium chermesinum]
MSATNEFVFNVAFTVPVNQPEGPILTLEEFWRGLERGGSALTSSPNTLVMADGAVHTAKDVELIQDVRNADNLLVSHTPTLGEQLVQKQGAKGGATLQQTEAITVGSGARSTMLVSRGGHEKDGPEVLYLTAIYELHVPDVEPGSEKAKQIERDYAQLAQGAARTVVATIRKWKVEGGLSKA